MMVGYQKQSIRFIWLVNLGLLAGLGYFIHGWLLSQKQSPVMQAENTLSGTNVTSLVPKTEDTNNVQWDAIAESGLFGKNAQQVGLAAKASLPLETVVKPVPKKEFPLKLRLLGTVAGSPATSFAVLEDMDAKQQDIFKVGDMICKARVEKILQNRIVMAYEGQLWPLDVSQGEGGTTLTRNRVVSAGDPPQEGRVKDVLMAMSDSEVLVNTLASDSTVRALSQATKGLSFASSQGGEDGIKLSGVSKSPVGRLIGLKEGDLIRSVNGRSVGNKRKAAQVLMKARKLGRAEFGIVRDHQEKTLSFKPGLW